MSYLRKIRYPHVAATLALVLAMSGGVVYAAKKIGTKSLKNNAVTSKKIKDGQVALKDLAADAKPKPAAAGTAGGAPKAIDYASGPGGGTQTLFSGAGLTLTGTCTAGPDSTYATTGTGSVEVHWTTFITSADGVNTSGGESDSFTRSLTGNVPDLLASDDLIADGTLIYDANGRGASGGQVVVINFHAEEADAVCRFVGDARVSA